jgi:hypothetical protein
MCSQPPRPTSAADSSSAPLNTFPCQAAPAKAGSPNVSRRGLFKALTAVGLSLRSLRGQDRTQRELPEDQHRRVPIEELQQNSPEDSLPNGKSRTEVIVQSEHKKALKDAEALVSLSNQLKDDLQKAGTFVVPVGAIKRTDEIEKLARSVRGHMQVYSNLVSK